MIGINDYLIKVESVYEEKAIIGGKEIFLSSIFEDAFQQYKYAKAISKPLDSHGVKADVGDYIFFSHLVFRDEFGPDQQKIPNQYLVDATENIYRIPPHMVYAYIHDGEIHMTPPFVFVKPIKKHEEITKAGIIIPDLEEEINQIGIVSHIHPEVKNFKVGDTVFFEKDSEYEVKAFGEKYYRMREEWLLAVYEE